MFQSVRKSVNMSGFPLKGSLPQRERFDEGGKQFAYREMSSYVAVGGNPVLLGIFLHSPVQMLGPSYTTSTVSLCSVVAMETGSH